MVSCMQVWVLKLSKKLFSVITQLEFLRDLSGPTAPYSFKSCRLCHVSVHWVQSRSLRPRLEKLVTWVNGKRRYEAKSSSTLANFMESLQVNWNCSFPGLGKKCLQGKNSSLKSSFLKSSTWPRSQLSPAPSRAIVSQVNGSSLFLSINLTAQSVPAQASSATLALIRVSEAPILLDTSLLKKWHDSNEGW